MQLIQLFIGPSTLLLMRVCAGVCGAWFYSVAIRLHVCETSRSNETIFENCKQLFVVLTMAVSTATHNFNIYICIYII